MANFWKYFLMVMIVWTAVSMVFCFLVWPILVGKANRHSPVMHSNERDNL